MSYIPQRYIVIRDENISTNQLIEILRQRNATYTATRGVVEAQQSSQPLIPQELTYILIIFILIFMITLVFITISPQIMSLERESMFIRRGFREKEREEKILMYIYDGVREVLRKIFLRIREDLRCIYCTPREISLKNHEKIDLKAFADVYERAVYGRKDLSKDDLERIREWSE